MHEVHRVSPALPAGGVELSERKLEQMIESLHDAVDPHGGPRVALRLPVEGFASLVPIEAAADAARVVGIYDMSRTGVAIVDAEPMTAGRQFTLQFPRDERRPLEVLCTARHCRPRGDGYIIGAEFGVSWLSMLGAQPANVQ